jgi:simple sugar transport system ATP-binding protein
MTEPADTPYAVEMRGITKRFPGVIANDRVDFTVRRGEIHALLGENGAGKSTLMNVLHGLYKPEEGQIFINGDRAHFSSPRDAIRAGIGMVHQHFMLVPTLTVAENLILGQSRPRGVINTQQIEDQIGQLSRDYGLAVDPAAKIWQLSVGEQQRVEILKMLYHGARILIMDEPTAVLTPQEVTELFVTLRKMTESGHTVIFISHKLDEVVSISDRVTVLRRGRVTDVVHTSQVDKLTLARLMVGREVLFHFEKEEQMLGAEALQIEGVSCLNNRELPALRSFSLAVRAGEIVGVAGVAGNGQTELAEVITGLRRVTAGRIVVHGEDVANRPATAAIEQGVAHIPADRTGVGSAPNLTITENLIMKEYRRPPVGRNWAISLAAARQRAEELVQAFDVKTPNVETRAGSLSGGNLQKLILAREIAPHPQVIVAVYPTRGLDVGAIETVHQLLLDGRHQGAAILLISEELDELIALADRIVVIYEGQTMGEAPPDERYIDQIGLMMAGTPMEAIGHAPAAD